LTKTCYPKGKTAYWNGGSIQCCDGETYDRGGGTYGCCSSGWAKLEKEDGGAVCCQKYNPEISNVDGDTTKNTEIPQLTSEGKCCFGTVSTHSYWSYKCKKYGCGQNCGENFPESYVENYEVCCPYGTTATLLTHKGTSAVCPEEVYSSERVTCCANGTKTLTACYNENEDGSCYSDYHVWTECK
jgi:hypothetical protein